jgi:hypothetical protein
VIGAPCPGYDVGVPQPPQPPEPPEIEEIPGEFEDVGPQIDYDDETDDE